MNNITYPANPDCKKCNGSGKISEYHHVEPRNGYGCGSTFLVYKDCDCFSIENISKIQNRCEHEFVCRKCGIIHN